MIHRASSSLWRTAIAVCLWLILCYAVAMAWAPDPWAELAAQAAVFAVAVVAALVWLVRGAWPARSWLLLPIAIAPAWGLLQLALHRTVNRYSTETAVLSAAGVACAFLLGLGAFRDRRVSHTFRVLAVVLGTALSALAIVQLFTSDGLVYWSIRSPWSDQPMGPFLNRDNYSAFIELLLPLALWEAVRSTRSAWLYGIPCAIMYGSVIAGASRAGSILVTLEVLAVLIPALLSRRHASFGAMPRAFAAITLIVVFATLTGWEELLSRFDDKDPYATRREYVQSSVLMVKDRPLLGSGLATWSIVYPHYAVIDMRKASYHAHNDWIEWACDGGLPFLCIMLIPALRGSWLSLRYPWGFGILAASLHGIVDFPFRVWPTLLCFFLLLAAMEARYSAERDPVRSGSG
jgi:hypothetical protein